MRPIPDKLRRRLNNEPRMRSCAYCGNKNNLEWHHALEYSGRQINEWYGIIALCTTCHRGDFGTIRSEIKNFCTLMAITRGLKDLVKKYDRRDWAWEKHWLEGQLKKYMFDKKI